MKNARSHETMHEKQPRGTERRSLWPAWATPLLAATAFAAIAHAETRRPLREQRESKTWRMGRNLATAGVTAAATTALQIPLLQPLILRVEGERDAPSETAQKRGAVVCEVPPPERVVEQQHAEHERPLPDCPARALRLELHSFLHGELLPRGPRARVRGLAMRKGVWQP